MDLKQSTAFKRPFKMISSSDHLSLKASAAPVVNISKDGGAFAAAGGAVTEVSNGWYYVSLNTTDTNTLGSLAFYITGTGADDTDFADVVRANILGDTLPVNVTQVDGAALTAHASGKVPADVLTVAGTTQTARDLGASVLLSAGTGTGQLDFTSGVVKSNQVQVDGSVNATHATGMNPADVRDWLGTAVTAATAGIPDVNTKNYNNVAAATDANNLPKVDVEDWKAGVIPAVNVTGVPKVDLVDWLGSAPNSLAQGKVDAENSLRANTAQANAADVTSIKLDASASATDNFYQDTYVMVIGGTGAGQAPRWITSYTGATKVANVKPNWSTAPDATSTFIVFGVSLTDVWGAKGSVIPQSVAGLFDVNPTYWSSSSVPSPNVSGVPIVDTKYVQGAAINALISGRVDANAQVVGDKTGYSIGSNGLDSGALTAAAKNAIADSMLDRNMTTGTDSGTDSTAVRTVRQALRILRNKVSISGGVLTCTKEDDSTASWTAAVTTTAGNPISTVDPT